MDFKTVVGQGIGEASMCWSEIPKGVFASERASKIVDEIMYAFQVELAVIHQAELSALKSQNQALRDQVSVAMGSLVTAEKYLASCGYGVKSADREPEDYMVVDFRRAIQALEAKDVGVKG